MAKRTIRARRASPYLLYLVIAFSLLMVVAAVGWGYVYNILNVERNSIYGPERVKEAAQTGQDLMRQYLDKYQAEGATNLIDVIEKTTAKANAYRQDIQRLTERLNGDPYTTQHGVELSQSVSGVLKSTNDILAQTTVTLQKSFQVGGDAQAQVAMTSMQAAVHTLTQRIEALVTQIKQDQTAITNMEGQLKGVQDELKAAKDAQTAQLAQADSSYKDEKTKMAAARDSAIEQSNRFKEETQQAVDRLIADRRNAAAERDKLNRQILTLQNNLKDLAEEIAAFRKVPTETGIDGHIVRIAEKGSVAYGDLGRKDGVLLGMPFSIFSPNDLGRDDATPKAQCRIVKIMEDACELRVYQLIGDNPVVTGDVLHNPVYDRQRRLRFMLVGKMDIDGDGVDDTEQLKALIQEFGGRIDSVLTVQTDYLIVGEEPKVVSAPAPGAGPMERQVYEEARKGFIEYTEAKAQASNFSIPALSLNRFLGLVGIAGQS